MRRAVLTLGSTVAGLAALLSFKTHSAASSIATGPAASTAGSQSSTTPTMANGAGAGAGDAAAAAPAVTVTPSTAKQNTGSQNTGSQNTAKQSTSAGAATTRTVTGDVANTQYGPMQVELTLSGQRITNVQVVQQTNLGSLSQQIDSTAIPKLNSETLAAQSARIDAVSGASYTSSGYIQSLQSALDKAKA